MIAQDKKDSETQVATEQSQKVETKIETKPVEKVETKVETKVPDKIVIDGVGEITLEELKNGYLRTSDYTKKTQDVANQRKEAEEALKLVKTLRSNPTIAQELMSKIPNIENIDPQKNQFKQLEDKVYDILLQQEISNLQGKYSDFEVREVLNLAKEKGINNLEDAYLLNKSTKKTSNETKEVDVDTIRKQIREELIKEFDKDKGATRTIISSNSGNAVIQENTPKMSEAEKKVAKGMHLTDAEYVKWRDKK